MTDLSIKNSLILRMIWHCTFLSLLPLSFFFSLFETIVFFHSSFFLIHPFLFPDTYYTSLTSFYFVCVFPCVPAVCHWQMGTKSRQRKVIFEFSYFLHKIACAINFFFSVNMHVGMLTWSFFSEWHLILDSTMCL